MQVLGMFLKVSKLLSPFQTIDRGKNLVDTRIILKGTYVYLLPAINRLEKRPQIHCFFSHTMKPDVTKFSSTIDYILTWPGSAFNHVDSL